MRRDREMAAALAESKTRRAAELAAFEASVRKHVAAGLTRKELVARLGCSAGKVEAAMRRMDLKPANDGRAERWRDL